MLKIDVIGCINEPLDKKLNILEFDCGLGSTLLRLKYMYPNSKVYGIETDTNVAKICGKMIEIMTEDFEENYVMKFNESKEDFFDYVILGTKLQFSTNPWKLLQETKKFLKPGGFIIANIFNVMHYSVIKGLLSGHFIYNNSIVDIRYNKFFTLSDIYKIFNECGYVNPDIFLHYYNEIPREDSEFLNQICSVIGENMKGHFISNEYLAKFQKEILCKTNN